MAAKKATKSKTPATVKDGLFISRKMRRDAEAAAKAEAEALAIATDDYADAADKAAYEADPKNALKSEAEKTVDREKAQAQATADARKKFGLK